MGKSNAEGLDVHHFLQNCLMLGIKLRILSCRRHGVCAAGTVARGCRKEAGASAGADDERFFCTGALCCAQQMSEVEKTKVA